ncbi:MAG: LysM peptidoglycan-binding domain-containing protein [Anaerocolumna sp.]
MNIRDHICSSYVIKQGDTLYSISRANNIPLALILRLNPFVDIYNLQVGDEICVPAGNQIGPIDIIPYVIKDNGSIK